MTWHCVLLASPELRASLNQMEASLYKSTNKCRVKLELGMAVVIDNWRVLHGREALDPETIRSSAGAAVSSRAVRAKLRSMQV